MKNNKKVASYNLDKNVVKEFGLITKLNYETQSNILEGLMREYILKNKQNLNDVMLDYWNKNIND